MSVEPVSTCTSSPRERDSLRTELEALKHTALERETVLQASKDREGAVHKEVGSYGGEEGSYGGEEGSYGGGVAMEGEVGSFGGGEGREVGSYGGGDR